jgi:uncharacterized protein YutE (UPF0331/DUF86 family)
MESFNLRLKVERLLGRIIERLIDINYHILEEKCDLLAKDYYNSFEEMAQRNAWLNKIAAELAPRAALRNALAHEYDFNFIDQKQIYASIEMALK